MVSIINVALTITTSRSVGRVMGIIFSTSVGMASSVGTSTFSGPLLTKTLMRTPSETSLPGSNSWLAIEFKKTVSLYSEPIGFNCKFRPSKIVFASSIVFPTRLGTKTTLFSGPLLTTTSMTVFS